MKPQPDDELSKRIDFGVRRGVARALAEHKQAGRSIYVWQDDGIVEIPPEQIQVPEVEAGDLDES